jgi:NAD(P)-dependent dehydrogenase (short-subunit alcohol dehydrogenase family)
MTLTDMTDAVRQDLGRRARIAATIAMNRCAEADEIAEPILWMLSDAASFVSGAILDASGGGFMLAPVAPRA